MASFNTPVRFWIAAAYEVLVVVVVQLKTMRQKTEVQEGVLLLGSRQQERGQTETLVVLAPEVVTVLVAAAVVLVRLVVILITQERELVVSVETELQTLFLGRPQPTLAVVVVVALSGLVLLVVLVAVHSRHRCPTSRPDFRRPPAKYRGCRRRT